MLKQTVEESNDTQVHNENTRDTKSEIRKYDDR